VSGVVASSKLLELAHGLYGLSIGGMAGERRELAGLAIPATHITSLPSGGLACVEVFAASPGPAGWLGPGGGTVGIKIPSDRGYVLITTYRLAEQEASPLEIQVVRIDRPLQAVASPGPEQSKNPAAEAPADQDVKTEIILHIAGQGDCRFGGGEWIGSRNQGRQIEAFSVRPMEKLAATDVEYKAYGPGGRETPWVTAAKLCGTRGRGISLTGFAIRLGSQPNERFDVVYEGAFVASGVAGPRRNGEPCMPLRPDDPLEAVKIRVIERVAAMPDADF
jgi:hypothetical protein